MSKITKFLYKNWQKKTILSTALLPLSLPYILAAKNKQKSIGRDFKPLVVCIGNVTLGGNGKTQVEIELAKILQKQYKVAFLSIGYKGSLHGPCMVLQGQSHSEVGEEALILEKIAPTCVAKNRLEGLDFLQKQGFEIVLMDDGYQNFKIIKDVNILVVYGDYGFGNKRLIPAGPLREPLNNALQRADIVCVVDKSNKDPLKDISQNKALYTNYEISNIEDFDLSKSYLAFSALGFNEKFFNTLKSSGFKLKETLSFKDHHFYSENDLQKIVELANKNNLEIVTTTKDYVKLPDAYKSKILEAQASLQKDAMLELADFITQKQKEKLIR